MTFLGWEILMKFWNNLLAPPTTVVPTSEHNLFNSQMQEYKEMIKEKENTILKLTEAERDRLLKREQYLIEQRDQFIQDLKDGKYK